MPPKRSSAARKSSTKASTSRKAAKTSPEQLLEGPSSLLLRHQQVKSTSPASKPPPPPRNSGSHGPRASGNGSSHKRRGSSDGGKKTTEDLDRDGDGEDDALQRFSNVNGGPPSNRGSAGEGVYSARNTAPVGGAGMPPTDGVDSDNGKNDIATEQQQQQQHRSSPHTSPSKLARRDSVNNADGGVVGARYSPLQTTPPPLLRPGDGPTPKRASPSSRGRLVLDLDGADEAEDDTAAHRGRRGRQTAAGASSVTFFHHFDSMTPAPEEHSNSRKRPRSVSDGATAVNGSTNTNAHSGIFGGLTAALRQVTGANGNKRSRGADGNLGLMELECAGSITVVLSPSP